MNCLNLRSIAIQRNRRGKKYENNEGIPCGLGVSAPLGQVAMKLSQQLRSLRQSQGLTMKKVAESVGVPVSTYRDWEYGSKVPASVAPKLAEVLRVSTRDLLGLTNSQTELHEVLLILEEGVKKLRRVWLKENT